MVMVIATDMERGVRATMDIDIMDTERGARATVDTTDIMDMERDRRPAREVVRVRDPGAS